LLVEAEMVAVQARCQVLLEHLVAPEAVEETLKVMEALEYLVEHQELPVAKMEFLGLVVLYK
jgi:hypothetical protein